MMNIFNKFYSRRDFLKMGLISAGFMHIKPFELNSFLQTEFPDSNKLGRICVGKVDIRSKPSVDSDSVGVLYEDGIVVWNREVVGEAPSGRLSKRWVETPEGYIYLPSVQPVKNIINNPIIDLPVSSEGKGMWVEVTQPFVDIVLDNPPARSPSLQETTLPRLYYSQILWVDDVRTSSAGNVYYRINEKYGYGDIFWAAANAFRPLNAEEMAPIKPEVENKKIVVDVTPTRQFLSCFEDDREVYYCQISSGAKWNASGEIVDSWGTPLGKHPIWRKLVSIHMSGGTTGGGYDLPGIAWTSLFTGDGVAIHSTFWHNDYGTPRSHGCINASPDDAKWIFRWTTPVVSIDPGDVVVSMPGGTIIDVVES